MVDLWNENKYRTFWFVVKDEVVEKIGTITQMGTIGWEGEEQIELTVSSVVPWDDRRIYRPYAERSIDGILFKNVFLTEKEAIETILPQLQMRVSWISGILAGYRDRLEELS